MSKLNKTLKRLPPKVLEGVAHRGLHNKSGIPENSMAAFKAAVEKNVAIELDVHLTKDGEIIVCHDETLDRVTGKEGIIEHLTLDEIRKNYKLSNGEPLPTLKEVLDVVDEKVPLLIEFKPFEKNFKKLSNTVLKVLDEHKIRDPKNIIFITFYPQCLWALKTKKYLRILLVGETEYPYMFKFMFDGVDLDINLFKKKKYQKSHKKRFTMCWTVEDEKDLKIATKYSHSPTFQFLDVDIVKNR